MRTGSKIGLIAVTLLGTVLSSCKPDKPNYPIIPAIEYKSFSRDPDGSGRFSFTFKDGDADLGRPHDEGFTFFCEHYTWDTDSLKWDFLYSSGYFIDPMDNDGKYHPYEGEIQVDMPEPYASPPKCRYKCWVIDRAGHKSNEVYTEEIIP